MVRNFLCRMWVKKGRIGEKVVEWLGSGGQLVAKNWRTDQDWERREKERGRDRGKRGDSSEKKRLLVRKRQIGHGKKSDS